MPKRILICAAAALMACTQTEAAKQPEKAAVAAGPPGSLEGDVYLVMRSGDTKRGAGNTVFLIHDSDTLQRAIGLVCDSLHAAAAALTTSGPAAANAAKARYEARSRQLKDSLDRLVKIATSSSSLPSQRSAADEAAARIERTLREISPEMASIEAEASALGKLTQARATARSRITAAILAAMADTSGTGMNAHYTFASVPAGRYALFAEWTIGENPYTWWRPVEVKSGQNAKVDLDNSSESRSKLFCGGAS